MRRYLGAGTLERFRTRPTTGGRAGCGIRGDPCKGGGLSLGKGGGVGGKRECWRGGRRRCGRRRFLHRYRDLFGDGVAFSTGAKKGVGGGLGGREYNRATRGFGA